MPFVLDQVISFSRRYTTGQLVNLSMNWAAYASVYTAGAASIDFTHTARWSGLQSAITSAGRNVTNSTIVTSASGFDYGARPTVPEPAVWAQLLAGFGLAGATIRHRRRKMA